MESESQVWESREMAGKEKGDPNLYKDGGEGKLQDEEWGSQSTTTKVQYEK